MSDQFTKILNLTKGEIPTAEVYLDERRGNRPAGIVIIINFHLRLRMYKVGNTMKMSIRPRPGFLGMTFIPEYGWTSINLGSNLPNRDCADLLVREFKRCRSFIPPDEFQKSFDEVMEIRKEKAGMIQVWIPDPNIKKLVKNPIYEY